MVQSRVKQTNDPQKSVPKRVLGEAFPWNATRKGTWVIVSLPAMIPEAFQGIFVATVLI